jgi:glycerate kinase
MTIVLAPDSFKDCLRSAAVCEAMAAGIRAALPEASIVALPMADGGEGTVEAVVAATDGELRSTRVHDPLGREIDATWGLTGGGRAAVLEMAAASGLELLADHERNPLMASTYGTGELIRAALDHGVDEILLGIGGSATVDGGGGLAQALGFRFFDDTGTEFPPGIGGGALRRIARIDADNADPRLRKIALRVACDVTNPLLGASGAARIYAPQKGATPAMVEELEDGLTHLADLWRRHGLLSHPDHPGAGAAGGLGAGMRAFCHAEVTSGAELVAHLVKLPEALRNADWILTGEGCTDAQTAHGKLCSVVAKLAHAANVPVILLSGTIGGDPESLFAHFDAVFSIAPGPGSLAKALADAPANLTRSARSIATIIARQR